MNASVKVNKVTADVEVPVSIEHGTTTNGKPFTTVSSEDVVMTLFPSNAEPRGKARILYNANVYLKKHRIKFKMAIKELESGDLLAGETSQTSGLRTVLSDWDGQKSYPRLEIGFDQYNEIIAMCAAAKASAQS